MWGSFVMTRVRRLFWLVTALLLLAAACGDSDSGSFGGTDTAASPATTASSSRGIDAPAFETTATTAAASAELALSEQRASNGDSGGDETLALPAVLQPADIGRDIIFTAQIDVAVDDVALAGERAQRELAGLGGILFGQNTTTEPSPRSVLTFKVFPEDFQEALNRLSGLGELVNQTVSADDVTERIVDLRSRITTSEASVDRLRTFLVGATDLQQVASLEGQLLDRETQLELLRGQLRTLENQVGLATIVLVLTRQAPPRPEPAIALSQTTYAGHDGGQLCPGRERLSVDEDAAITICVEVANVGTTALADVEVEDHGLDIDPADVIVVEGDLAEPLLVGDRLIVAYEVSAKLRLFTEPSVLANPIDDFGQPIREHLDVESNAIRLTVAEDTSLPGFGDSFGAGVGALFAMLSIGLVVLGVLLPFVWVPIVALAIVWWVRRRQRASSSPDPAVVAD